MSYQLNHLVCSPGRSASIEPRVQCFQTCITPFPCHLTTSLPAAQRRLISTFKIKCVAHEIGSENLKNCRKLRSWWAQGQRNHKFTTTTTPHLALSYLAKTGMEWNVLFKENFQLVYCSEICFFWNQDQSHVLSLL